MGYFRKKYTGRGWENEIFRGIEKIKCGNSRGQGKEFSVVIKEKSCEISTSLKYRRWSFQRV